MPRKKEEDVVNRKKATSQIQMNEDEIDKIKRACKGYWRRKKKYY